MIDLRLTLPRDDEWLATPPTYPRTSVTLHWPGASGKSWVDDDEVVRYLKNVAQQHIDQDWNDQMPGAQHGSGIMYAYAVSPSGTIFQLRDPDTTLWHSGSPQGNTTSRPILVIYSDVQPMTSEQTLALTSLLVQQALPVFPHQRWSNTSCPGPALLALLKKPQGGTVDRDTYRDTIEPFVKETIRVMLTEDPESRLFIRQAIIRALEEE